MKRCVCFFLLLLLATTAWANHWDPDTHQFPDNMNVIGVIEINGIELAAEGFELGAFCGDECRGSEMLTYYEGLNRYMVFMTLYGQSGHVLSFRLYDHSTQRELELTPPESMSFVPNAIVGAIQAPYVFSFSGGMGVITTTVVPEEGGAVTGGGAYWIGETCTLRAVANDGYTFVDWTEDGQQVSADPIMTLLVTTNHDLQANFVINSYEIIVEAQPDEGGSVTGQGTYDYGMLATVSALPNDHYEFVNWTEDGMMVSNSSEYTFEVNRDRHLIAHFAQESFVVSATVNPENAGIVEGVGNYAYGQMATLVANPNENYAFVGWLENGVLVSTQASFAFMVTHDMHFEAKFVYYDGLQEWEEALSVFPNPTVGRVTIKGVPKDGVVQVVDGRGNSVMTKDGEGEEISLDLSVLPDGYYLLFVHSQEGRQLVRLIKSSR